MATARTSPCSPAPTAVLLFLLLYGLASSEESDPFPEAECEALMVNCSCFDLRVIAGIVCEGRVDLPRFDRLPEVFPDPLATYEITLTEVSFLPDHALKGLIVYRLFLEDAHLGEIAPRAFDGVKRLRRFHVRQSSLQVIPDFSYIRDSLRSINLDNSRLSALNGTGLRNLPLVTRLFFVNNSIEYLDPDVFEGTDGVIIFDISHNRLVSLPPRIFEPWTNLTKVVLSHNRLIDVGPLFAVTHPRFLYLDFNNLSDADSVLHLNMSRVETVFLSGNPLRRVSDSSFNGRVPNVRFLYLDRCLLTEFRPSAFQDLSILATLDVSYNLIEEVPPGDINFGRSLEIDIMGNRIHRFEGELGYSVKRVYLEDNLLETLGRTLQYTQMTEVSVARNRLQALTAEDLRGVHALQNLELQGNRISRVDRLTFLNIRNYLHYLDVSANRIQALNGSIRYLSQLKSLNASENLIQSFEAGEFTGLNELSELYLQHNRILALGQLQQLPQLQYLVVSHNSLQMMSTAQIPKSVRYIYLRDNPFQCDCAFLPFLLWLNDTDFPRTDVELCRPRVNASYDCPKPCSCACAEDASVPFMSVDCSSRNLTALPPFLLARPIAEQNATSPAADPPLSLAFDQTRYADFHVRDRVRGVDLEDNELRGGGNLSRARLPPDLLRLAVARNRLTRLPESLLFGAPQLRRVTLSGNPWECDCDALGFKKWILSKEELVTDVNVTKCGPGKSGESSLNGRTLRSLTDLDLCPADIGMYVSAAFGILTFLLLCLAAKILYTKFEMNIKVFLYAHGITWVKERDLDMDKKFDAFVSFSHKDEAFVDKEIINVIEAKDPNIRLCVHYRNFQPGEFIHDNILNAVQNSKRTVLVLTRNFLESEWCLLEFRAAHVQALEDKVHRIIVIKAGDLPKEIDPSIKVYLDSTTYLTWGEKHFWNNLLYVLPTRSTVRNAQPRNRQRDIKDLMLVSKF